MSLAKSVVPTPMAAAALLISPEVAIAALSSSNRASAHCGSRMANRLGSRPTSMMSPEQIRGSVDIDTRTDLCALGAVLRNSHGRNAAYSLTTRAALSRNFSAWCGSGTRSTERPHQPIKAISRKLRGALLCVAEKLMRHNSRRA
jgi:hypothetical protein